MASDSKLLAATVVGERSLMCAQLLIFRLAHCALRLLLPETILSTKGNGAPKLVAGITDHIWTMK